MIRFQCPGCKTVMNAPDEFAGRKGSCPKCGLRLELPPPLPESTLATPLPPRAKPERKETPPPEPAPAPEPALAPEPAPPPEPVTPPAPAADPGRVNVKCPGCGREIPLAPNELSLTIECSRCSCRFVPAGTPPPPVYTERRRDERIGRAEDIEHIESVERVEEDDAEELQVGVTRTPAPQSRSPLLFVILGGVGIFLMSCCGVGGCFLLSPGKKDTRGAKAPAIPVRPQRPALDLDPDSEDEPGSAAVGAAGVGLGLMFWGCMCIFPIAYIISVILLLAWVAKDARARGVDGGAVWILVILLTHVIGLVVYLASRPQGQLVVCQRCGNKRLMAARTCPHCGEATA